MSVSLSPWRILGGVPWSSSRLEPPEIFPVGGRRADEQCRHGINKKIKYTELMFSADHPINRPALALARCISSCSLVPA